MQTTKMISTRDFEQWLHEQADTIVRFRQIEKSPLLAEYIALKQVVESTEFQSKKIHFSTTRYVDTPEGKTMARYRLLKRSMPVILYRLLHKEAWKEKTEVAEYLQLTEQIQTKAFIDANTFWKNPKRWFTTPESEQEKKLKTLAKHADIVFFYAQKESNIVQLESYKLLWSEECDGSQLGESWQTGFLYTSPVLQANHSHINEQQANTRGKNTTLNASTLYIDTKKEKTNAPAWHPTKGMFMHDFEFTSDVWHTEQAVAPATGVLQAKIAYKGGANHVFCLTQPNAQKNIHLLDNQHKAKGFVIYTLHWNEKEVVLYANNKEANRFANPFAGQPMHLLLRSCLPQNTKAGKAQMAIDWIRIYTTTK